MDATWPGTVAAGLDWAAGRLRELGCRVAGRPGKIKESAWSAVYRIRTSIEPAWFKPAPG